MSMPRTRKEAREIDAPRYFTGAKCLHGHISNRITVTARCEECNRIFNREHKRRQAAAKGKAQ